MKTIFKKGDKVFCHYFGGWGVVEDIYLKNIVFPIRCSFPLGSGSFTQDGRFYSDGPPMLSFTEYTLEGFSQERPEELPKPGDIVWVRNEFPSEWEIGYFFKKEGNTYYTSASKNLQGWRSAGLEIRTTNPYANEQ
jgi:hypothetical protein